MLLSYLEIMCNQLVWYGCNSDYSCNNILKIIQILDEFYC